MKRHAYAVPGKSACEMCGQVEGARYHRGKLLCPLHVKNLEKAIAGRRTDVLTPAKVQVEKLTAISRAAWEAGDQSTVRRARALRDRILNTGKPINPARVRALAHK